MTIWLERDQLDGDLYFVHIREPKWNPSSNSWDSPQRTTLYQIDHRWNGQQKPYKSLAELLEPGQLAEFDLSELWEP